VAGDLVGGVDASDDRGGLVGAEPARKVAFSQVAQRAVEPAHGASAAGDQLVMALGQQSQHGDVIVGRDQAQTALASRGDSNRARVVAIGLGALLVVQQANPSSQRRWHIEHALAGGDELLRQQRTRTRRAFDRPHARFEARRPVEESLSLETVRCHRQLVLDLFVIVEHDRDMRAAVRTDSDDEHQFLPFLSS
jgi:hypothetical protein